MRTLKDLRDRKLIIEKTNYKELANKEVRKPEKELTNLIYCIQYLETNLRSEFIESEIIRVEKRIETVESDQYYAQWINANKDKHDSLKDPRKSFENEFDLSILKKQLKTLIFISGK